MTRKLMGSNIFLKQYRFVIKPSEIYLFDIEPVNKLLKYKVNRKMNISSFTFGGVAPSSDNPGKRIIMWTNRISKKVWEYVLSKNKKS